MCGGTSFYQDVDWTGYGLSPRVRGNPPFTHHPRPSAGSIPACAGEPYAPAGRPRRLGVYPRVCGGTGQVEWSSGVGMGLSPRVRGNPQQPGADAGVNGLSPRVRGNLQSRSRRGNIIRSIPACAGEPLWSRSGLDCCGVYPRVCGGTLAPGAVGVCKTGLSPRVRGNRSPSMTARQPGGSIPACAGEPFIVGH